jgi:lipid-A-disaccharide synthase-like uncharacterized protein
MRRVLFWLGWAILFVLPVLYAIEIIRIQNVPAVQIWKWAILAAAILLIYFNRNRDQVFNHHVV